MFSEQGCSACPETRPNSSVPLEGGNPSGVQLFVSSAPYFVGVKHELVKILWRSPRGGILI